MLRQIGLLLILLLSTTFSFGQNVIVHGNEQEYAGMKVAVDYVFNPITGHTKTLDTLHIDDQGGFSLSLAIDELTWIQMELGVYRSVLLLRPDRDYQISFPARRDKTEAETMSPFFESPVLHLQVEEGKTIKDAKLIPRENELNTQIFGFDTMLYRINTDQLVARQENRAYAIDPVINNIEENYVNDQSDYFSKYRIYRYGLLQMNSGIKSLASIFDNYLVVEYPELHNPAYLDLFSKMYEKFFYYFSRTDQGENLNQIINLEHDLHALRAELRKHNSIANDTIADLVILKEVSESFYRDFFYKEALLILLDSLKVDPSLPIYATYAEDIHAKLTKLMIGTSAPEFSLPNQFGKIINLTDFRGKYIFIMFCTPDNYSCMKEYPFLKAMHAKHSEYLEVLTVMVTESVRTMLEFNKKNDYTWTTLYYGSNDKILDIYSIRAYPTCYLVGRDGLLIQSPATLPTEGFEQQLFRIMRSRGDL